MLAQTALVLHAGAIGDAVLATVVPSALKTVRPDRHIIYWTHPSLIDLLRLCPAIDDFVPWDKKNSLGKQMQLVAGIKPDIIVDLTASLRTRIICLLSGVRTLTYAKESPSKRPILHAAENFVQTIASLTNGAKAGFPTLYPTETLCMGVMNEFGIQPDSIALVSGVGKLRSHRGWPAQSWNDLARKLSAIGEHIILIGGPEDAAAATEAAEGVPNLVNLCGRLTLPQTAAALSACSVAVSGDTGPAHIAVAVGTPVVGLLGPTSPMRSGPFGYLDKSFDAGQLCKCQGNKMCVMTGAAGPGECMKTIAVDQVFDAVCAARLQKSLQ